GSGQNWVVQWAVGARRCGVGDFGRSVVAGAIAHLLGELEDRFQRLVGSRRGRDAPVAGFLSGGPCRAAGGRGGDVVRPGRIVFLGGGSGEPAGEGQRVHGQGGRRARAIVARRGDFAVAHAVAEKEDDVLGAPTLNLLLQRGSIGVSSRRRLPLAECHR